MTIKRSTSRPSSKPDLLSQEQLQRVLVLLTEDPALCDLHDVVVIMSNTGIRRGELRELRWADVDLQGSKLTVAEKKNARMRSVPLGPETLQVLQSRRERQPDAAFVLGESPLGLLRRVSRQFRTVCEGIGVRGVALHVLRCTFATRLVNANTNSARAQVWTLRERLLRLGTRIVVSVRRMVLHLPALFPHHARARLTRRHGVVGKQSD